MYLIAGELVPTVIHISTRTIHKSSLSIHGDHTDAMSIRQTGFAMLFSTSVQDSLDMALVSHCATMKSRLPFANCMDGFRIS
jgi:pyruvate-ferredoxin/flavodoxin oxidoreductase